jgi:hypothetical protein
MIVSQYNKILVTGELLSSEVGICMWDRGSLGFPGRPGQRTREGTLKHGGLNVTVDLTEARNETRGRHRRRSGKVTVIPSSSGPRNGLTQARRRI